MFMCQNSSLIICLVFNSKRMKVSIKKRKGQKRTSLYFLSSRSGMEIIKD